MPSEEGAAEGMLHEHALRRLSQELICSDQTELGWTYCWPELACPERWSDSGGSCCQSLASITQTAPDMRETSTSNTEHPQWPACPSVQGYYLGGRQQRRPHVGIQHHKLHLHILRPAAHEHVRVVMDVCTDGSIHRASWAVDFLRLMSLAALDVVSLSLSLQYGSQSRGLSNYEAALCSVGAGIHTNPGL